MTDGEHCGCLKFADDLVSAVVDGEKTATVRLDGQPLSAGDVVSATTDAGNEFARLRLKRTADVIAVEAYSFIEMVGAKHGAHGTDDLVERLRDHYDNVNPGDIVSVYVFEVVRDV